MDTPFPELWCAALARAGYVVADAAPAGHGPVVVLRGGRRSSLTILALPDSAARGRCAEHLARWSHVDDPGIDQLDDALDLGDAVALVRPCAGGTLAEFVDHHGRLTAGQASTLLVVLGRALARLHADGLVYGPMTAHDVRIVGGQPRLVVPGPMPRSGHGLGPSPAEDAYHLAALADSVVAAAYGPEAQAAPAAVLRALNRIIVSALGDAQSRPGVGTLAALSHDVAPCQPLVLLEPPADASTGDARGRDVGSVRSVRRVVATRVGGLVVVLAAAAWWSGAGHALVRDSSDDRPVVAQPGEPVDGPMIDGPADGPAAAAAALTVGRFDLLARMAAAEPDVDARAWAGVTVLGSPAHTQVLELVSVLVADGSSVSGLSATVESATLLEGDASTARVEVVYATSEYAVRGAVGSTVIPAATGQSAVLTLVRTDAGWRVSEVAEGTPEQAAEPATAEASTTLPPTPATGA